MHLKLAHGNHVVDVSKVHGENSNVQLDGLHSKNVVVNFSMYCEEMLMLKGLKHMSKTFILNPHIRMG